MAQCVQIIFKFKDFEHLLYSLLNYLRLAFLVGKQNVKSEYFFDQMSENLSGKEVKSKKFGNNTTLGTV